MFTKYLLVALLALVALPALAAPQPLPPKLPIVVSFSILKDLVQQVGGDAVTVTSLVGPDGDAHSFEGKPGDAEAVANAKLVIVNGLDFDNWMQRLVNASGYKGPVIVASAGVKSLTMIDADEGNKTVTDPHAWQDVSDTRLYVKNITVALITALPEQEDAIKQRAATYDAELAKLDAEVRAQIAAVPADRRTIITSHDAFGYFGRAYGVIFLAPEGISTEAQPSAAAIVQLQQQIRAKGVHTLFFENMTNTRLLNQIAKDTGTKIGGTLYADALSPPAGPAPTYLAMMRHNLPLLVAGMR